MSKWHYKTADEPDWMHHREEAEEERHEPGPPVPGGDCVGELAPATPNATTNTRRVHRRRPSLSPDPPVMIRHR